MLTPGYSITATERILPSTTFDFTTGADARIACTRAGATATRINSSGYVETVAANTARFDFDPVTLLCNGLLIEGTRQNVLTYSEDFTNAVWTTSSTAQFLATNVTSPANNNTAATVTFASGQASGIVFRSIVGSIGQTYTYSVWVRRRAGTGSITLGNVNGVYSSIAVTSVWQRFSLTSTSTSSTIRALIRVNTMGDEIDIWGAQLELAGYASSYIPTTNSATTRNADVVTVTGTNFSSWWQATTGAMAVKTRQRSVAGTSPWLQLDDTSADNIIAFRGSTTNPELYIKATTDQATIDAGTIAANANNTLCGAWTTDNCAAAVNGAVAVTDTSATIPTVTQARLGSDGTNYLDGWLQTIRYWPLRILSAEVQAFSK